MPYAVLQQGGSSSEWYVQGWETEAEAYAAMEDIKLHTYEAAGPYELPKGLTKDQEEAVYQLLEDAITGAVRKTLGWE